MATWDLTDRTMYYIMEPLRRAYAHLVCGLEAVKLDANAQTTFPSSHRRLCNDIQDILTMSYFMRHQHLTIHESANFDRLRGQSKTLLVNASHPWHNCNFSKFYDNSELQVLYENPRTIFAFVWNAYEQSPDKGIRYVGEIFPFIVDATGSKGMAILMLWLQHVPLDHKCRFMYELAVSQAFCRWLGFPHMKMVQAVQMYETTWGLKLSSIRDVWDGHDCQPPKRLRTKH